MFVFEAAREIFQQFAGVLGLADRVGLVDRLQHRTAHTLRQRVGHIAFLVLLTALNQSPFAESDTLVPQTSPHSRTLKQSGGRSLPRARSSECYLFLASFSGPPPRHSRLRLGKYRLALKDFVPLLYDNLPT